MTNLEDFSYNHFSLLKAIFFTNILSETTPTYSDSVNLFHDENKDVSRRAARRCLNDLMDHGLVEGCNCDDPHLRVTPKAMPVFYNYIANVTVPLLGAMKKFAESHGASVSGIEKVEEGIEQLEAMEEASQPRPNFSLDGLKPSVN